MSSVRKTPTGSWELSIRHKLLPRPLYLTYPHDQEAEARQYGEQVDRLLAAGIVPVGLVEEKAAKPKESLAIMLRAWMATGKPAQTDMPILTLLVMEVGQVRINELTYAWCEKWVQDLKLVRNFAPGTIRKRVGSLSRCLDWWLRSHPDAMVGNPLTLLPRGSSSYSAQDAVQAVALGKKAKVDVVRDRRLLPAIPARNDAPAVPSEFDRIMAALDGVKRPDRQRPLALVDGAALRCLFLLVVFSGVRLREGYTMTAGQVDLAGKVIRVRTSKQWHGRVKWRNVPMRREAHAALTEYLADGATKADDLLFPWWSGERSEEDLTRATRTLVQTFRRLFAYAGCEGLTEHDLRHEATCQWFEMRRPDGSWIFRPEEINNIMGWEPGSVMATRYASFRAEDLATRLW